MNFIHKNLFTIAALVIILTSICLRFISYNNRWGLAYDQAHDAIVARYALFNTELPLLGPFSSAGPFQTGGEWYWFIMVGTVWFPFSVLSPWVFMTSLYVLFVVLFILFSRKFVNWEFALITGGIAAVSPAQISQGTNLTNQSPQAFMALLSIWLAMLFMKTKNTLFLFLLALCISAAASIHLQGAALIALLFFTFVFSGVPKVKHIIVIIIGLFIPWIPVLLVDLQNNFFNTRNMLQYYSHDQYAISLDVLGRRWLTYAGVFWPKMWGFVAGGNVFMGYFIGFCLALSVVFSIWKRQLQKEWIVLFLSFMCMVIILRYTRTPLFESYIVFLHPFIILFSGWLVYFLFKRSKAFAIVLFFLIVVSSMQRNIHEIAVATNTTAPAVQSLREMLSKKYPGKTFTVYDFQHKTKDKSYPFVLYLMEKNLTGNNGMRIGLIATDSAYLTYPLISKKDEAIKIVNLEKISNDNLKQEGWGVVTPEEVYISTEEWYKRQNK